MHREVAGIERDHVILAAIIDHQPAGEKVGAGPGEPCTASEGIAVVGLIDAIERAAAQRGWVAA